MNLALFVWTVGDLVAGIIYGGLALFVLACVLGSTICKACDKIAQWWKRRRGF